MTLLRRSLPLVLALGVLSAGAPLLAQSFPEPIGTTVNDFADLLPEADEDRLVDTLTRLDRETGVELTVVTLDTQARFAPDLTLEAFATALFDDWGVGQADTNDGVMILVLSGDRAMRIELGAAYGRDWDRVARDVVDRSFLNAFEVGDYPRGLVNGTEAVIERIVLPFRDGAEAPAGGGLLDGLIVGGMFLVVVLAMARRRIGDALVRLRPCPHCGRRGLSQTRSVLGAASETAEGTGERLRACAFCGHEDRSTFTIPRRKRSSGRGSFGGGRSGGGGASGRW